MLDLYSNQVSGSLPESLTLLKDLKTLHLHKNVLEGELLLECINMKLSGISVELDNNAGFTLPDTLGDLQEVDLLNLSCCSLIGSIPESIGQMSQLQKLDLSYNQLTGAHAFSCLTLFVHTSSPHFFGFRFADSIPDAIGLCVNLVELWLCGNKLTGAVPASLAKLVSLQSLRLNNNRFEDASPEILGQLAKLTFLDLQHNSLPGALP